MLVKEKYLLKKGGVQAASLSAPQLKRNINLRTALARFNAVCRPCRVRRLPCSI